MNGAALWRDPRFAELDAAIAECSDKVKTHRQMRSHREIMAANAEKARRMGVEPWMLRRRQYLAATGQLTSLSALDEEIRRRAGERQ